MFAPDFLPPEIKKVRHYWKYKNKKYRTRLKALTQWYRDQVKSGHIQ